MTKVFRSFRFNPQQYAEFRIIAKNSGSTVTEAFEKFMRSCIDANALVYAESNSANIDAKARVLIDWLKKGKRFYRSQSGEEENVQGSLFEIIPKIKDTSLLADILEALKNSATENQFEFGQSFSTKNSEFEA